MLHMKIVRSPLAQQHNEAILSEYNRLASACIPIDEFVHWVQHGPEGPAWHAILETDEGRIVGHTSAFPLRAAYSAGPVPAKSEYSFLHENFRSSKIRGFESLSRPAFVILIDSLFQHCYTHGWGPIFASTNERNQIFTRKVGLRPVQFPLSECLFVLKPARAARYTPNLDFRHRAAVLAAGLSQRTLWSVSSLLMRRKNGIRFVPLHAGPVERDHGRFAFFEDSASLEWRYLKGQYFRVAFDSQPEDYLVAKCGGQSRYVRVCQWRLTNRSSHASLIQALLREAARQNAMGVRWAVYEEGSQSEDLVNNLRRSGFLCAKRIRTVMIHKNDPKFLDPKVWKINDSLFSFDP